MKKLLLGIITILPLAVYSDETIYTNYYIKELNSSKDYQESDTLKKETLKLYNNYQLERIDKGYYEINYDYIKDETDFITEYDYSKTKKYNSKHQHTFYSTKEDIEVNKFEIRWYSVSGSSNIESIKIYNVDKLIFDTKTEIIKSNTKLIFDIKEYVPLKNIKIELKIKDTKIWVFSGTLTAYSKNESIDNRFSFERHSLEETMTIQYLLEEEYNELLNKLPWVPTSTYITYFPVEKTKYQYYTYEKKFSDIYTKEPMDNYELDYDNYKETYNYFERYYITLSDKISDYENLNTLIIDTNMNLNILKLNLNEKNNNYLLSINYLADTLYKSYLKEIEEPKEGMPEESNKEEKPNNDIKEEPKQEIVDKLEQEIPKETTKHLEQSKQDNIQNNKQPIKAVIQNNKKEKNTSKITTTKTITTTKVLNASKGNKLANSKIIKHLLKINFLLLIILFVYKKLIKKRYKKSNTFKTNSKK